MKGARAVVDRFLAAANAHDIDATVACLSEGFECRGPDGFSLGRVQMRVWLGWEVVMGHAYALRDVRELGDSLTAVMVEESELYRLLGMQPREVRLRFEVSGGLIRVQEFEPLQGPLTFDRALRPFLAWVDGTRPGALLGARAGDAPVFSRESAERWLRLLREWSSSDGPPGPTA